MPGMGGALLLGRDGELECLTGPAGDAAAGRGRLALIEGEPGIGKTWLLRAFFENAAGLFSCRVTGAAEEFDRRLPFATIDSCLKPLAAGDPRVADVLALLAYQAIALIDGFGARSGFGDDWLRIWGLKLVLDGGVEGAAMEQPYANDPANSGHLNWEPAAMTRVCAEAARRGWRIGAHAVGDRALRTLLDIYEAVVAEVGPAPPWTLVIEHAMLSDTGLRDRAVRGGFGITVQHPVLWNMGSEMLHTWGPERTRRVTPIDQWLAAGADLAAGTDIVRPFNPMTAVWGMVTRGTKSAGVLGPEHAIDMVTALRLYTAGTAALNGEADRLGSITPGKLADLVGYPADPLASDPDGLKDLTPAFTMVGGRATHDPDKRLAR